MSDPLFQYTLVGGSLEMPKKVLVQDVLSSQSLLRRLFSLPEGTPFPRVDTEGGRVIVTFDPSSARALGDNPRDLLAALVRAYPGQIRGRVQTRSLYTTHPVAYLYELTVHPDGTITESGPL